MRVRLAITLVVLASSLAGCLEMRRALTGLFSGSYGPPDVVPELKAVFTGKDTLRRRIPVKLTPVATGFDQPTDIQFDPANHHGIVVLEKTGRMKWSDLASGDSGIVTTFDVATVSEQGLLGMTFHPAYPDTPLLYVNLTPSAGNLSRILELRLQKPADIRTSAIVRTRTVMEVEQPYQNHNAGQLAFGPDGYLYIGWGDGGWIGDPHNNGQNPASLLGKMLRIDPALRGNAPYGIPPDNPFADTRGFRPEIWAMGLRNPWRYSFDQRGRLIVADVGQNAWEEIDIVEKGKNYGWRCREARSYYDTSEGCSGVQLTEPFYYYGREEGLSITGGYVYQADEIPALKGLYVFGDFISGRIWALKLPEASGEHIRPESIVSLGQWPLQISTFGRDARGRIYVVDYGFGIVYRIAAAE